MDVINSNNSFDTYKSPQEIRKIIENALVDNQILGYLHNNLLYMKSFGKNYSLDRIFAIIGFVVIFGVAEFDELFISKWVIIIPIGIGCFILSFIFSILLKFYLVYDIDREVFYTITNIFNKTVKRTEEIKRRDIVELGVDVSDKDNDGNIANQVFNFKGNLIDNPGLKTSFVALRTDGNVVYISDPQAKKQPHLTAVARCKLFSQCFGVKSIICNKDEALQVIKEDNDLCKFIKYSKVEEWKKAKKNVSVTTWLVFVIIVICGILVFLFN